MSERSNASPLVSVIILAYQQPVFLNAALASVAAQTHREIEIIIVDDASDSALRAQYVLPDNARLIVNEVRKATAAVSRNVGIQAARGKYIAFLDQDDLWLPEKLALQVKALESTPKALLHYTNFLRVDEAQKPLEKQNDWGGIERDMLPNLIWRTPEYIVCCSSVMIRRDAFEKVGLFDENIRLASDWDMWLRLAAAGKVAGNSRRLVKYRVHDGQWSRASEGVAQGALAVLEKTLEWVAQNRRDLRRLVRRQQARWLRELAQARLDAGRRDDQTRQLLRQSVKIWPLDPRTYRLLWRVRRANAAHPLPVTAKES